MLINARRAVVVGLALGIAVAGSALAGPPYVTDDPETPPRQAWEINLPYVLLQSGDPRTAQEPLFDINYGLTDAVQLELEFAILDVDTPDGSDNVGLGDTQLGVKWRFLDETSSRPQLAFYPQVVVPTGSESRGLGAGSPSYIIPMMVQKSWGPWTAFTNVGWVLQTASATKDYAYYGATLSRAVTKTLRLGAELYGNGPTAPGASSDAGWNVGLEWQFVDRYGLLASGGHSLRGGAGTTIYVGVQLHLGKWSAE
jgi:hypothetical protein